MKTCCNCGKNPGSGEYVRCYDFTCYVGFIDGDHNGWVRNKTKLEKFFIRIWNSVKLFVKKKP